MFPVVLDGGHLPLNFSLGLMPLNPKETDNAITNVTKQRDQAISDVYKEAEKTIAEINRTRLYDNAKAKECLLLQKFRINA
jgi:hypothetical protein